MKKFEQKVLDFKLWDTETGIKNVEEKLSQQGQLGFRVINSIPHGLKGSRYEHLTVIMEKEVSE